MAAVHGAAVGVGTTMLLHCDLVVAGRSAKLSLPFVALGLVPEAASTLLLPRAIGHLRATELLLLGEPIDAETALRWGLVNRIVDDERLIDTAMASNDSGGRLPFAENEPASISRTHASIAKPTIEAMFNIQSAKTAGIRPARAGLPPPMTRSKPYESL